MAGNVMDKVNEARGKAMERAEQVRTKIGRGSSGGRLFMGAGGIGSSWGGLEQSEIGKRVMGMRTNFQARIRKMRGANTKGGPLDILMRQDKVEKPELKYDTISATSKVIKV